MKKKKTTSLIIGALLLGFSWCSYQGTHPVSALKKHNKAAPLSEVPQKVDRVVTMNKTRKHTTNIVAKKTQKKPQTTMITPQNHLHIFQKTWISGDACTAPTLGKLDKHDINPMDFFELNIYANGLPSDFKNTLRYRLAVIFHIYYAIIGRENMRKLSVNIHIHKDWERYQRQVESFNSSATNTLGVYSVKHAIAAVYYQNKEQAIRTALHEATHMLTHAYIGRVERWLGEGIAEYMENIVYVDQQSIVELSHDWTKNKKYIYGEDVHDFFELSDADPAWRYRNDETKKLYASSWFWIHYLLKQPSRKKALFRLLRKEMREPCSALNIDQAHYELSTVAEQFEIDFKPWQHSDEAMSEHYWMFRKK